MWILLTVTVVPLEPQGDKQSNGKKKKKGYTRCGGLFTESPLRSKYKITEPETNENRLDV